MYKILQYLKTYLSDIKNPAFWVGFTVFLASGIYVRYALKYDTYFHQQTFRVLKGTIFYLLPYLFGVCWYAFFKKHWAFLKSGNFWLLSLSILFVLVANQYLLLYKPYIQQPYQTYNFLRLTLFNLFTAFVYAFIPILYWFLSKDKADSIRFGLTLKNFDSKPYLWMLAIMIPLLIWASFQDSFLSMYPRYRSGSAEEYWQISHWWTIGAFELTYILQFICLEWFFRGFMVMKLERYLGKGAVFPMVAVYAFIHFGKPMPETIGSIFGGYILGVIALSSRSVFGGVLIHVGVALLMELLALIQHNY